jgi:hypothetical protein
MGTAFGAISGACRNVRGDVERWELDDGKVNKIHPSIFIHSFIYLLRKGAIKGGCLLALPTKPRILCLDSL